MWNYIQQSMSMKCDVTPVEKIWNTQCLYRLYFEVVFVTVVVVLAHWSSWILVKSKVKSLVAALRVFLITMATVTGPTPPGTGVTIPATWHT